MKYAIITGDTASVDATAGAATVTFPPAIITGSGGWNIGGKKVCIDGDEASVLWTGTYVKGPFVGGTCTATIKAGSCKKSSKVSSRDKAVIMEGPFEVEIKVVTPAVQSGSPDTTLSYTGTGKFSTVNSKVEVG